MERLHLRPSAVDTNYATRLEAVGVGVLDVGDVPPYLVYRGEGGSEGGEQSKSRQLHLVNGPLTDERRRGLQHARKVRGR